MHNLRSLCSDVACLAVGRSSHFESLARVIDSNGFLDTEEIARAPHLRTWLGIENLRPKELRFLEQLHPWSVALPSLRLAHSLLFCLRAGPAGHRLCEQRRQLRRRTVKAGLSCVCVTGADLGVWMTGNARTTTRNSGVTQRRCSGLKRRHCAKKGCLSNCGKADRWPRPKGWFRGNG